MQAAYEQALLAQAHDDVPIGAVIVKDDEIIAACGNRVEIDKDPTSHAEMLAIRQAVKLVGEKRIPDCHLYATLEPCAMCAGAIVMARLASVTFAAADPKGGAIIHGPKFFEQSTCHHYPKVIQGPMIEECSKLLVDFFKKLRG